MAQAARLAAAELRTVGTIAGIASGAAPADVQAAEIIEELRELVPFVAAEITYRDPVSGAIRELVNAGYPKWVYERLHGEAFYDEIVQLGRIDRPLCLRDLPDPLSVETVAGYLAPAGYVDGMTARLKTLDGRHVGLLNLSTDQPQHPTEACRDAVACLSTALANVVDVTRSWRWLVSLLEPGSAAVLLDASEGMVELTVIEHDSSPLCSSAVGGARRMLASGRRDARFVVHAPATGWVRVRLIPCGGAGDRQDSSLVVARPDPDLHGLTPRELEVLTLLAEGRSNPEIAVRLFITTRTVRAHVERILQKLEVPTRAAAASKAVNEGLLLPELEPAA